MGIEKWTIKKTDLPPGTNKMNMNLQLLFTRASKGEIPMHTPVRCIMKTDNGYRPEGVEINVDLGNIFTIRATLEQLQDLAQNINVISIAGAKPLQPTGTN